MNFLFDVKYMYDDLHFPFICLYSLKPDFQDAGIVGLALPPSSTHAPRRPSFDAISHSTAFLPLLQPPVPRCHVSTPRQLGAKRA